MPETQINFPLWTFVGPDGRQPLGGDDDGSPLLPVWETEQLAVDQAPPGMLIVPLRPADLADRLQQMPGDSTLALFLASGMRYRLPAKQALAMMQQAYPEGS